jgi:hypothetical protein
MRELDSGWVQVPGGKVCVWLSQEEQHMQREKQQIHLKGFGVLLLPILFWASSVTADPGSAHAGRGWDRGPDVHHWQRFDRDRGRFSPNRNDRWRARGNRWWWDSRNRHGLSHRQGWSHGVGGLITGIVIGQQLSQSRDHHFSDRRSWQRRDGWPAQPRVTQCYRVERLRNGRERRVALPLSRCR